MSHTKCSVLSYQGSPRYCFGYAQHINIAAEQQQAMAIDEGKDEEIDGKFENETDNIEYMEGNDGGDFDDGGEE
jgi:hypothetical protein